MANDLVAIGPKQYGGLQPTADLGGDTFVNHDHGQVWDDEGGTDALLAAIRPDVAALAAEQAKRAVLAYGSNAYADLAVIKGKVVFMLDMSNNEAAFAPYWDALQLMLGAVQQAEQAGDQVFLKAFGEMLDQLVHLFRPPVAVAPPPRQRQARGAAPSGMVRPGAARTGRTAAE
jgi:hypothetical protein